ncbi:hypothetical protein PRZ48_006305 [Zasmidium cellare]|uniref:Uncharacterized protein n=1 Tax=Zasmidium cellare TaxID=395010 RepID=A0ABR0EMQ7_ZASCE|nr:hypothetical protein PRZ48_006305 [Zasmidium cellare]
MAHDEGDDRADQADRALGVEHTQPGQNSFAIAAVQRHRYMIQANAFYQQEWSAREGTPPSEIHPAFRQPDLISNLAQPIPRWSPQPPHAPTPPPPTRESTVTTMSSLQRAAAKAEREPSEEINLGTTPNQTPRPTQRAFVEERAEQRRHLESGATDERIPVFHPTPKDNSDGFDSANAIHANARNASTANARDASHASANEPKHIVPPRAHTSPILDKPHRESSVKFKDGTDQIPDKTPKKGGFASSFGRFFRPSSSRRSDVGTTPRPPSPMPSDETPTTRLPPKAKQVLVGSSTPDPKVLGRSPSKKGGFFSRRTSDLKDAMSSSRKSKDKDRDEDEPRGLPPRASTSMGFRADAGSLSAKSQPMTATPVMQGGSESGGSSQRRGNNMGLSRHHSLSWRDSHAPPTPPSKDTPPDEKIIRHLDKQKSPLTSFTDTPSRAAGFVSSSTRMSPSRSGSYGQRFTPRLVTAPSMHSIRASVAVDPQGSDPDHLREMNDRIGGLGLEGFNMPSQYQQSPSLAYSPSVYSQEWGDNPRNSFIDIPDRVPEEEGETTPTRPTQQMTMIRHGRSLSTGTLNTAMTSATCDLVYPELRNDPSIAAFQKYELTPPPASNPPSASNTPAMAAAFQDLENALQSTASAGSARDQRSMTPQTPEPRQLSRTEERRAPLANLFGLSTNSGSSQTPRSQDSVPGSAGSVTSFRLDDIDFDALSSGRKDDIHRTGALHPAHRTLTQKIHEMSPMSNHSSVRVSPLEYRQLVDKGYYLVPAAYHPTAPGNSTGLRPEFTPVVPQDAGVARMRQALAAEHESPAARRRPSNIMDSRPNLAPTNAAAETGVRSPRGAKRFPRSRDLSPVKESSSSESRPASPTRVASPSRIPRPSHAHQLAAPRTEQQQPPNSLGIHEQTSRAPRTSPFGDDTSVTRMTNAREEDRRRFTRESQALNASLDRRFARTKKTLDGEGEGDSGVDIENYKNNTGSRRSDANEHKRLSTHHARQFYLSPSPAGETPDNSRSGTPNTSATNESEASTLVLTPNLPFSFPRPPGGAPVSSSQLAGYEPRPTVADMSSPTPAEPRARGMQAGNASTMTGGGDVSGEQRTSRKISAMTSGRTGAASGNTVTSSNNTSTTSTRRAPTRVSSLESTAHTSSSDTLPSTATSRKTSTTAASSINSSRAAPGTAQAQIAALNNRFAPPAHPPPTAPLPPAPPNMGAGADASQAQQLQLLMSLAQQQGETLRNLTLQMNRLEMNQRVQATLQVNGQAGQTVMAPVNQQQMQAAQQTAQATQQAAQVTQQTAQATHQANNIAQVGATAQQASTSAQQASATAQQADHPSSDEDDGDGWFNPG